MTFRKYLESLSNLKDQDKETLDSIGDPYKIFEVAEDGRCFFCSEIARNKIIEVYDPEINMSAKIILVHGVKTEKCLKIYEHLKENMSEIDIAIHRRNYRERLAETIRILNNVKQDDAWIYSIFLNYDA